MTTLGRYTSSLFRRFDYKAAFVLDKYYKYCIASAMTMLEFHALLSAPSRQYLQVPVAHGVWLLAHSRSHSPGWR